MDVIANMICHLQNLCGSFSRLRNNTPHHNGTTDEVKITPAHTFIAAVPAQMYVCTCIHIDMILVGLSRPHISPQLHN